MTLSRDVKAQIDKMISTNDGVEETIKNYYDLRKNCEEELAKANTKDEKQRAKDKIDFYTSLIDYIEKYK